MGEENCLPTVEESTEPPICAQRNGNYNGPPTTAGQHQYHQPNPPIDPPNQGTPASLPTAHTLTPEQVARALNVDIHNGLSATEAESRLRLHGPNKVKGAEGLSLWEILLRQVSNSLTLVLVITMGLSFGINDYIEGGVITAVIVLNICVGFWQDYKAEKTIQSLKSLTAPESFVLRDGTLEKIRAVDLVPGDVVHLKVGSIVPADLRLIDAMNASTDEAFLTGESLPVDKTPAVTFDDENIPTGDRTNLAFSGSEMKSGRCTGIVVATAMETEVGKIAHMLRQKDDTLKDKSFLVKARIKFINGVKTILGLVGTPLQITLSKFALLLFGLAILLAIIVFSANKWQVGGEVLIYGICVAVAVIPESLIAVLTITIAVGAKAMARSNVIIRVSSAIEAVGGVTNICSDKTGTLTQGRMITRKAMINGVGTFSVHDTTDPYDPSSGHVALDGQRIDIEEYSPNAILTRFLRTIALCNLSTVEPTFEAPLSSNEDSSKKEAMERMNTDDERDTDASTQQSAIFTRPGTASSQNRPGPWKATGEPTEIALHVLAMRFNMGREKLLQNLNISHAAEFPFDSTVKKMTVVFKDNDAGHLDVYTKGATEFVLPVLNLSQSEKASILEAAETMAADGLRVLCIAHKTLPLGSNLEERKDVENELNYIGLVAIYDPPRLETKGAVRECQIAGITVHMLTGDHPGTARAIAHEVGILNEVTAPRGSTTAVMLAKDFDQLSDEEIDRMETLPLVVARCSPATKVKMVSALHRRKRFCVMTGDGVNDSPALKIADVGMAMGTGSDVAKDAAKMVLTDDNFASIVKAVEEGRRLFDNIQKFLMHLLISNIAQVILLLIGLAFKDNDNHSVFPLSPIEILWVNLITSSFLAIGLGLEESQTDSMFRPPHDLKVGVFTKELIVDKFIYGFFMGSLCLASFAIVAYVGPGGGDLGSGCNEDWNDTCGVVFRARATTYTTITLLLLVTAWEVKHFSRSLFNLYPDSSTPRGLSVFPTVWRNRFLFWAVTAGFSILFAIIYLPVINRQVFKHGAIGWEWGISFACVCIYIAAIESWKAVKRRFGIWSGAHRALSREDAEMRAGLSVSQIRETKHN
ncbi:potassium/sodium eff [Aaosphaeria arxii CBS 175.79]|uniref:P-type Na(+) transporter n=1 Tax=Aaosphaeria arxii CBS 175.79 TaxID=1450172 RepID=A0A6A5Y6B0_9PLEO|nr:potassium/sodium eff [Aaosphaeria arxii CBS 175.79]KAF2021092.1 potassium/sodium eff [Aaosphaeria arxii CBS 175.79]